MPIERVHGDEDGTHGVLLSMARKSRANNLRTRLSGHLADPLVATVVGIPIGVVPEVRGDDDIFWSLKHVVGREGRGRRHARID